MDEISALLSKLEDEGLDALTVPEWVQLIEARPEATVQMLVACSKSYDRMLRMRSGRGLDPRFLLPAAWAECVKYDPDLAAKFLRGDASPDQFAIMSSEPEAAC